MPYYARVMSLVILIFFSISTAFVLPPHPRLILTPERASNISASVLVDPTAGILFSITRAQAEYVLTQKPPSRSGPNSTPSSRVRLQNLYSLVMANVGGGGGNGTLVSRAKEEILGPCSSPQWDLNGTVQLNSGEMLHVCGFAFDWLYAELNATERGILIESIVSSLTLVRQALGNSPPDWAVAFVSTRSNWNTVILGGAIMASLSLLAEPGVPSWVEDELLPLAIGNLKAWSALGWGPDGAWPEGPNYGGYAARYLAPTISALFSSLGSDSGLSALPGVLLSPSYLLASMAPNLEYFYYYDTKADPETVGAYLAFAALANDTTVQRGVLDLVLRLAPSIPCNTTENDIMNAPVALLYYPQLPLQPTALSAITHAVTPVVQPLVSHFRGGELVTIRKSSAFVGFKGRNTSFGLWAHTHLDAGTFVFQYKNQWWVQDLGSDSYSAPGYFWKTRFNLYRTSSLGHNTVTFKGANQYCEILSTYACNCSQAQIIVFNESTPSRRTPSTLPSFTPSAFAIVDLSDTYRSLGVQRLQRGFIVSDTAEQVIVVDEVDLSSGVPDPPPPLWVSFHTVADVALTPDGVQLSMQNITGVVVEIKLLSSNTQCPGASFSVIPIELLPPLLPCPSMKRITLSGPSLTCKRVSVAVGLLNQTAVSALKIRELNYWQTLGPLG